jgi:hypothetical protein
MCTHTVVTTLNYRSLSFSLSLYVTHTHTLSLSVSVCVHSGPLENASQSESDFELVHTGAVQRQQLIDGPTQPLSLPLSLTHIRRHSMHVHPPTLFFIHPLHAVRQHNHTPIHTLHTYTYIHTHVHAHALPVFHHLLHVLIMGYARGCTSFLSCVSILAVCVHVRVCVCVCVSVCVCACVCLLAVGTRRDAPVASASACT